MNNLSNNMFDGVYFYFSERLEEQFDDNLVIKAAEQANIPIWDTLKWQLQHHIYNQLKEDC